MSNIGVFAWNWRIFGEKVTALEAEGHRAIGHAIAKIDGYEYENFDRVIFLDYAPEALECWKAKAAAARDEFTSEIEMAEKPRDAFSEPLELPKRKTRRKKKKVVVEDGSGVDGANSYNSVEDVTAEGE